MNKFAKALYDNTAECADELAFKKGDIITVMEQNVAGTSGWWMCSLYGRKGLAPANRLQLLARTSDIAGSVAVKNKSSESRAEDSVQNIYQIPSIPRTYSSQQLHSPGSVDMIYKAPLPACESPNTTGSQLSSDGSESSHICTTSSPKGDVYDVPSQIRQASLFTVSTSLRHTSRKHSLVPVSELEKRFESERLSQSSPGDSYMYAAPPSLSQDPNYDIPVPSVSEAQQKMTGEYKTLPNPRKNEWIYDVPSSPEKQSPPRSTSETMPSKVTDKQIYDKVPSRAWPEQRGSLTPLLYDIPKPNSLDLQCPPKVLPRMPIYDKPQTQKLTEDLVYAVPPKEESSRVPSGDHIPLECRGDSNISHDHTRGHRLRMTKFLTCASIRNAKGNGKSTTQEEDDKRTVHLSAADSQRISTASNSSTSSCDSLALSSSSPEPLREVNLCQDEVSCRLLALQESVCKAVPQLMDFVSSRWRSKEHLEKHLEEIKDAAEGIACTVTSFLSFALDIKGNAQRLTDANLQTRLYKQLSIVEDSSVILQQTVRALNMAGWPLETLCQDPGQVQTPDQLERFVMVARTVPEDVKRLVSIINANGKLLFRPSQKETDGPANTTQTDKKKNPDVNQLQADIAEDDSDYVELQTNTSSEEPEKEVQKEKNENATPVENKAQAIDKRQTSESCGGPDDHRPTSMEHCRLYFGALQKAIGVFVCSLQDGQPPEHFISQSKLVIMVGQRLVDTLCREAQRGVSGQSLLCMSNHLCALLKQLAVATKKAALHFPDKQALHEAKEFAKELAQRAQHFRMSLDI